VEKSKFYPNTVINGIPFFNCGKMTTRIGQSPKTLKPEKMSGGHSEASRPALTGTDTVYFLALA
jgi:hypothetical protein